MLYKSPPMLNFWKIFIPSRGMINVKKKKNKTKNKAFMAKQVSVILQHRTSMKYKHLACQQWLSQ